MANIGEKLVKFIGNSIFVNFQVVRKCSFLGVF